MVFLLASTTLFYTTSQARRKLYAMGCIDVRTMIQSAAAKTFAHHFDSAKVFGPLSASYGFVLEEIVDRYESDSTCQGVLRHFRQSAASSPVPLKIVCSSFWSKLLYCAVKHVIQQELFFQMTKVCVIVFYISIMAVLRAVISDVKKHFSVFSKFAFRHTRTRGSASL
ncbi:hypothetical protein Plhal710r2_c016g0073241 [Plasmopara halstedii]